MCNKPLRGTLYNNKKICRKLDWIFPVFFVIISR
nr:MAG TPA: hypothetical protein [Caudoviricetes sp.]